VTDVSELKALCLKDGQEYIDKYGDILAKPLKKGFFAGWFS
jgi:hypothetical protein